VWLAEPVRPYLAWPAQTSLGREISMLPDLINGTFEALGAMILVINIFRLVKDKCIKGVSWLPVAFFSAWGLWNLYYYPHLEQWLSFIGGIGIVTANIVWLTLVFYYSRRKSYEKCS
jgi:hypothetical protein